MKLRSMLPSRLYRGAQYLVAEMSVDPARAAKWLPRSLSLASPIAEVFTASFPHSAFGSVYLEAGVFLRVRHFGRHAIHCPWMAVDDDVALILGRDLLGYPKKLAELSWTQQGDRIQSRCERRGVRVVAMEAELGRELSPVPFLGRPHRNLIGALCPRLVAFTPREVALEVREADIRVTIEASERDPLHELGLGPVRRGRLHRVDLMRSLPPIPVGVALHPSAVLRRHW